MEIEELVRAALAEHDVPGCAVGIVHGGETRVASSGLARTEPELAFLPEARIPVASMTKPFTATAVLALVEDGAVDLDQPVRRYLPGFRVADDNATARVTVRHLLTHRVGWRGDEEQLLPDRGDGALAAQVAAFASLPQVIPPDLTFSYANTGWDVAGRLVEVVEGESYESVLRRRIFEPLGMDATTFFAEEVVSRPAASGHVRDDDGTPVPVQDAWLLARGANPSGGLISTVGDQLTWLRWWLGELDGGDVAGPLAPATRRRMHTELVPVGAVPASTGLGWHVDHHDGVDSVYHEGSLRGTATMCRFVPDAGLGVVVLTNADDGELVYRQVCDRLLAELAGIQRREPGPDRTVHGDVLAGYAGRYQIPDADGRGDAARITAGDGTLSITFTTVHFDEPIELAAGRTGTETFAILDGPWRGQPVEFIRRADGALLGVRLAGRVFPRTDAGTSTGAGTSASASIPTSTTGGRP